MRRVAILVFALTVNFATIWTGPATAQKAPESKWCDQWTKAPIETKLAACTAMIESGEFAGNNLADIYLMRGRIYFFNKDESDRALADFDQALKLNPRYAAVYYFRSFVHMAKHDTDAAIADLSEAITLNPDDAVLYRERAFAYSAKRDYEQALADLDRAIQLDPDDYVARHVRGSVKKAKGDK